MGLERFFIQEYLAMTRHADPSTGLSPASAHAFQTLIPYGWSPALAAIFLERSAPAHEPARVVAATRGLALLQTVSGELWGAPSGRFRERLQSEEGAVCAGDWLVIQRDTQGSKALMLDLLPRGPSLTRRGTGPGSRPQCLASNLDVVLILMGLDRNFNPARMERLLALAWGSGAQPVVILTKADLEMRSAAFVARIEGIAPGVEVRAVSSVTHEGLEDIQSSLAGGLTAVMVGSSGVGKSTLLNALAHQELRRTREVRATDGRGRHTTSLRELFLLPGGGCLIDTPGIREVGLLAEGSDLENTFADIATFAAHCRFRDCTHSAEPGCAVQAALAEGLLDTHRYGNYLRLRREVAYEAARNDERLWREREQKWRRITKNQKHVRKG